MDRDKQQVKTKVITPLSMIKDPSFLAGINDYFKGKWTEPDKFGEAWFYERGRQFAACKGKKFIIKGNEKKIVDEFMKLWRERIII